MIILTTAQLNQTNSSMTELAAFRTGIWCTMRHSWCLTAVSAVYVVSVWW
jgi:hypothetical protein